MLLSSPRNLSISCIRGNYELINRELLENGNSGLLIILANWEFPYMLPKDN